MHVSPKLGGDCMASYIYWSRIASSVFPCNYCYDLAFNCSYCFNNHIHSYSHISHFMHEMHYIATLGHILTTMSTFFGFDRGMQLGHVRPCIYTHMARKGQRAKYCEAELVQGCQFSLVLSMACCLPALLLYIKSISILCSWNFPCIDSIITYWLGWKLLLLSLIIGD